jgi:hypothetical protein
MKQYLLFPALLASSILILGGLCWAQCPEEPNDLGFCDTLIAVSWDERDCDSFPCLVHFSLLVTHDSNTFYWAANDMWVQDSIAAFQVPLKWNHTNPSAYCSLSLEKNNPFYDDTVNGIFRHFGGKRNRLLEWYEMEKGWTAYSDFGNQYFAFSVIPLSSHCQRWWEGDSVLLSTLTFTVSDTMTIWVDTTWIMGMLGLTFTRTDAVVYFPRDNMPLYATVKFFTRGDANGDGLIDIADVVYLINYLFVDGPPPPAIKAGDANCDGVINIADVVFLINYLFIDGPEPSC